MNETEYLEDMQCRLGKLFSEVPKLTKIDPKDFQVKKLLTDKNYLTPHHLSGNSIALMLNSNLVLTHGVTMVIATGIILESTKHINDYMFVLETRERDSDIIIEQQSLELVHDELYVVIKYHALSLITNILCYNKGDCIGTIMPTYKI